MRYHHAILLLIACVLPGCSTTSQLRQTKNERDQVRTELSAASNRIEMLAADGSPVASEADAA